jgi:DHA2 family multidrug resistance protein
MIPLSQALLLNSYPKEKSGTALGIWSITTLIAPVVGPILGGWISDNYSWPWIFLINIPIGLGAAFVIWKLYGKRESPTQKLPIDRIGLALLVLWVGSLQIMLDKGKELDWFNSSTIVGLGISAIVGLVFFLIWELTEKHPIVDLTLFKKRNFWTGVVAFSLAYGTFFGNLVLLPLWLQTQLGYTATDAGWVLAPVGLLAVLLTPIVGKNLNKWDPRWVATAGFAGFALVFFLRSGFTTGVDMRALMIPTILQGVPMALFFVPLTAIILSGLPPEKIPAASGLANFCRMLLGGFGSSIATTLCAAHRKGKRLQPVVRTEHAEYRQPCQSRAGAWSARSHYLHAGRHAGHQRCILGVVDSVPDADRLGLAVATGAQRGAGGCGWGALKVREVQQYLDAEMEGSELKL